MCAVVVVETYVVIGVASYYFVLEKATFCHGKKGALALVTWRSQYNFVSQ